ncbi:MAG: glycosyltransferase family 4 protein [Candidatus Scalindua sp.]|nr:glycosyltransferase family 4 protein [Candidatus Scalindua sp.]
MNEVIDYLREHADLIIWDLEESGIFETRVNKINFRPLVSQFQSNIWGIKKLGKIGKGEIIIINSYLRHRFLFFALYAKYIKRCQPIIFVNAIYHYSLRSAFLNNLDRFISRVLLRSAAIIIANSNSTKEELMSLGISGNKIKVIYPRLDMPPINDTPIKNGKDAFFHILFIGYCEPLKELHVLIKAVGKLNKIPFCLHIIGDYQCDPEYVNKIKCLITDLGIEDKVVFHGRMGRNELSIWLKKADLFVSPSRGEGYGRALAEAMYFGLPVIGADKGASKELIESGINGFLFKSGSDESLALFISKLYEDAELRRQFGADSKALINKKANFDQNLGEQFFKVLADKNFIPKNN